MEVTPAKQVVEEITTNQDGSRTKSVVLVIPERTSIHTKERKDIQRLLRRSIRTVRRPRPSRTRFKRVFKRRRFFKRRRYRPKFRRRR